MKRHAALTSTFNNVLGVYAKLNTIFSSFRMANPPQADSASRLRLARAVAVLVSLLMPIGLSNADSASNHSFTSKDYIRSLFNKEQSSCLIRLYGKESAFNPKAIGNLSSPTKSYVYGIPQLKNPLIKDMNAYNQIDYGIKYIKHRYETPCRAYAHWVKRGWH